MTTMKTMFAALLLSIATVAAAAVAAPPAPADALLKADVSAILTRLGADPATLTPQALARVKRHVERILGKPTLQATWDRKKEAWPGISRALQAEALPEEIGFLAWAESGFRPEAASPMGSRGVWQFIPATARKYGLTVTDTTDDRLDTFKETRAAAKYLKKLIDEFPGAPLLALTAYNQGEAQVSRIVAAAPAEHAKDFFWLAEQGALNEEGTEYVPRFLAAAAIGMHPDRYGLK